MSERLKNLVNTISVLEYQPLLKIVRDSQSLQENVDIDHKYQLNQLVLFENNERLERAKLKSADKSEMVRREQALKDLNEKLETIEKTFKSTKGENSSAGKEIDTQLKTEISTLVESLNKKLKPGVEAFKMK